MKMAIVLIGRDVETETTEELEVFSSPQGAVDYVNELERKFYDENKLSAEGGEFSVPKWSNNQTRADDSYLGLVYTILVKNVKS